MNIKPRDQACVKELVSSTPSDSIDAINSLISCADRGQRPPQNCNDAIEQVYKRFLHMENLQVGRANVWSILQLMRATKGEPWIVGDRNGWETGFEVLRHSKMGSVVGLIALSLLCDYQSYCYTGAADAEVLFKELVDPRDGNLQLAINFYRHVLDKKGLERYNRPTPSLCAVALLSSIQWTALCEPTASNMVFLSNTTVLHVPVVYEITFRGYQHRYVGYTHEGVSRRFENHLLTARDSPGIQTPLATFMRKVGIWNSEIRILEFLTGGDNSEERERTWIEKRGGNYPLLNVAKNSQHPKNQIKKTIMRQIESTEVIDTDPALDQDCAIVTPDERVFYGKIGYYSVSFIPKERYEKTPNVRLVYARPSDSDSE